MKISLDLVRSLVAPDGQELVFTHKPSGDEFTLRVKSPNSFSLGVLTFLPDQQAGNFAVDSFAGSYRPPPEPAKTPIHEHAWEDDGGRPA